VDRLALATVAYQSTPPITPPAMEALRARDVHLIWARVMPWTKDGLARVEEQLNAALADDPRSPDVRRHRAAFFMFRKDFDAAKSDLDAALVEAPTDPRTLLALVSWHRQRVAGATRELEHDVVPVEIIERLAQSATTAPQLSAVASYHGTRGRIDEAMKFSTRALAADPLCWSCQAIHASLLLAQGRPGDALAACDRALAITPERVTVVHLVELRRRIEKARTTSPGR
jgi:tetratricopeptide (TPR) repeat protein